METLASSLSIHDFCFLYCLVWVMVVWIVTCGGCGSGWGLWWWGYGILLGPEKTSRTVVVTVVIVRGGFGFSGLACIGIKPVWFLRLVACGGWLPVVGGCLWWVVGCGAARGGVGWCGVGVLFENCIVDASIFVVKLLRANGGCLGTRSR